jgi:hypothetical protein
MAVETPIFLRGPSVRNGAFQRDIHQVKTVVLETPNTVDAANTLAVDLSLYGGSLLWGVLGFKHTTDGSVIVTENPTTAVVGTTATLTVPAGTDDDPRIYVVFFT